MKRFVNIICLISLLAGVASPVTAATVRDVVNALEIPFRSDTPPEQAIHDIEGDFLQESSIASLDRTQEGRGDVALKFVRQGDSRVPLVKFRWEYEFPTPQEIVSDGETMWVYVPENNQVIESDISEVSKAAQQDPLTFLTGLGNLSRDFLIRWASPNRDAEGNYVLKLTPKNTTVMFRELEVTVDERAVNDYTRGGVTGREFPIRSTLAVDPNDNRTRVTFVRSTLSINRGVSDLQFRFIPPAGVDIVRPSGQGMGY